jgi:hypothetical protein
MKTSISVAGVTRRYSGQLTLDDVGFDSKRRAAP